MAKEYEFKVEGMDCAEETTALTAELGPVFGEENLRFDLLNAKLIVSTERQDNITEIVTEKVRATGMKAVPWEETKRDDARSFVERYGRTALTTASFLALAAGFSWHAWQHGSLDALASGDDSGHAFPLPSLILYVAAIVCGGWYIFPKAWLAAKRLRPDMNLLMTIAVIGAALISEWFEAATVTFLFAVALALEAWSVGRARRAIGDLMNLSPATARYRPSEDAEIVEAPVGEVPVGATVIVRPGERIPLDGTVTKGRSTINQAPITGESKPISKALDDELFAGTLNEDGALEFRVDKKAADTTLARIIRMVEDAQSRRAQAEQWVQQFARYYTPAMIALAVGIAVVPPLLLGGSWYDWFYEALVILVIACPCALVISTPVSVVTGLSAAARNGVLIKGGVYLEAPSRLRAIAMDKTGTLTLGHPEVQEVLSFGDLQERDVLERAAAMEMHSEHPIARAILRATEQQDIEPGAAEDFQAIKGRGAELPSAAWPIGLAAIAWRTNGVSKMKRCTSESRRRKMPDTPASCLDKTPPF